MGLVIGITEMQIAGLDSSLGLDKHFAERAQAAGKQVGALETADEQFAMFDGMSQAEQLQDHDIANKAVLHLAELAEQAGPQPQAVLACCWYNGSMPAASA